MTLRITALSAMMLAGCSAASASDEKTIPGTICRPTYPDVQTDWIFYGARLIQGPAILSCPMIKDTAGLPLEYVDVDLSAYVGSEGWCRLYSQTFTASALDWEEEEFEDGPQTLTFSGAGIPTHYSNGIYGLQCGVSTNNAPDTFVIGIRYSEET